MANCKPTKILLHLLGVAFLTAFADSLCPDRQICKCTDEYINCTCLHRENITFQENGEEFTGQQILIEGCGKINISKLSLQSLNVESVDLSNLSELHIATYAFDESRIHDIRIHNVSVFALDPYGLANIKNITNLVIDNVTLENMLPAVLADTEPQNVIIRGSHIGTIHSRCLNLQNTESVVMENNVINAFNTTSFTMTDVRRFVFNRNMVMGSAFGSITLVKVEDADFGYCSFRSIMSGMFVGKNVDVFAFHDNSVETCEERALWGMQADKEIRFVNNRVLVAKNDSLFPNRAPNHLLDTVIRVSENNSVVCDCNIKWLFDEDKVYSEYQSIKEKNTCHGPPELAGLKLMQVELSRNKAGTCISLKAITTTTIAPPTLPTTTTESTLASLTTTEEVEPHTSLKPEMLSTSVANQDVPTQTEVKERYRSRGRHNSSNMNTHSTILVSLLLSISFLWHHMCALAS